MLQEEAGQFVLHYFADEKSKKPKGSIYLDECEQVPDLLYALKILVG